MKYAGLAASVIGGIGLLGLSECGIPELPEKSMAETPYIQSTQQEEQTIEDFIAETDNSEEISMEQNIAFLMEQLGLNELRAAGTAKVLATAGCGNLAGVENKVETAHAYAITLINDQGDKFFTSFSYDGYVGPIRDEHGVYLYTPVE